MLRDALRAADRVAMLLVASVIGVVVLAGCSDGSQPGLPAGASRGEPGSAPAGARASSSLSSQAARAAAAARPVGQATCSMLPAARARAVLGGVSSVANRDLRRSEAAKSQLDGCRYTTKSGMTLAYLVWEVPTVAVRQAVLDALPTAQMGARSFSPRVGGLSAGAVLVTGPVAIAQVNAINGGRLVQVTVTARTGPEATAMATAAARTLAAA